MAPGIVRQGSRGAAPAGVAAAIALAFALASGVAPLGAAPPPAAEVDRLKAEVARKPGDAAARFDLAIALPIPERKDEALGQFERAIELDVNNLRYGNEYRRACVRAGEYQRAIDFLEKAAAAHPEVPALHLNLALAYVDKMPTAGLGIVGQGLLSNRSIKELDLVLKREPGSWAAMYGRAMNHLHWPKALRHAPLAIADFESCLKLQSAVPAGKLRPHNLLPYLGLADAYVKNGQLDDARKTLREAGNLFPADPRVAKRMGMGDDALRKFVDEERGLARPIDTDISFVWNP